MCIKIIYESTDYNKSKDSINKTTLILIDNEANQRENKQMAEFRETHEKESERCEQTRAQVKRAPFHVATHQKASQLGEQNTKSLEVKGERMD